MDKIFRSAAIATISWLAMSPSLMRAQQIGANVAGSSNVHVLAHLPSGGFVHAGDIEIEQELARPYAYMALENGAASFEIIDLKEPTRARVIYTWSIENSQLHLGLGALQNKYFKLHDRYYDVQSFQFSQGGPDVDLGAVILDVTGLP